MGGVTPAEKTAMVRQLALEAGFVRVGMAVAEPVGRVEYFREWLARGCAGSMDYLARWQELRADPCLLLQGARSVIVVAWQHEWLAGRVRESEPPDNEPRGRVARYAWGRDYHRVMRKMLRRVVARLHSMLREPFETRVCVDTAPIIEREVAAAAGVGWIGKNTMVIDPRLGSMFMLGEIITTLVLEPTPPVKDRCGTCRRCLDACPTGALVAPYQMDASRCISYLTIEHRGEIPAELKPRMGNWVFGCDICQQVCPYNREKPGQAVAPWPTEHRNPLVSSPRLADLIDLSDEDYRCRLAGSAMKRATSGMLRRNAAIALSNLR